MLIDTGAGINIVKESHANAIQESEEVSFLMRNDKLTTNRVTKLRILEKTSIFHVVPNDFSLIEDGLIGIKDGERQNPPHYKVLYRAYIQKDQPKIRAVYGYPTTITLMKTCFAIPLIEAYKNSGTPIAYGYDMAVGGAYRLRRRLLKNSDKYYGCLDFTGFDKTVPFCGLPHPPEKRAPALCINYTEKKSVSCDWC